MPEMDGINVIEMIKRIYPHVEMIMISDSWNMDMNCLTTGIRIYNFRKF